MSAHTLAEDQAQAQLITYIREKFLAGDPNGELTEDTPLLEFGVLDSLKVAILLNFIRDEMATNIPMTQISGVNFKNVRRIAALVCSLSDKADS
ncbi:acyl carrier protein [Streptomyces sp. NPDC048516]|uniref:acyl carrier protein n=1 Tax=Streptomyces sp. NPDC048516 TaxID=3365565 RepID=UPI003716FE18